MLIYHGMHTGNMCAQAMPRWQTYMHVWDVRVSVLHILVHTVLIVLFSEYAIQIYDFCESYVFCFNLNAYFIFKFYIFIICIFYLFIFMEPVGGHIVVEHTSVLKPEVAYRSFSVIHSSHVFTLLLRTQSVISTVMVYIYLFSLKSYRLSCNSRTLTSKIDFWRWVNNWLQAGRPRDWCSNLGRVKNFLFPTFPKLFLGSTQSPMRM
jgi:hypothetical protein